MTQLRMERFPWTHSSAGSNDVKPLYVPQRPYLEPLTLKEGRPSNTLKSILCYGCRLSSHSNPFLLASGTQQCRLGQLWGTVNREPNLLGDASHQAELPFLPEQSEVEKGKERADGQRKRVHSKAQTPPARSCACARLIVHVPSLCDKKAESANHDASSRLHHPRLARRGSAAGSQTLNSDSLGWIFFEAGPTGKLSSHAVPATLGPALPSCTSSTSTSSPEDRAGTRTRPGGAIVNRKTGFLTVPPTAPPSSTLPASSPRMPAQTMPNWIHGAKSTRSFEQNLKESQRMPTSCAHAHLPSGSPSQRDTFRAHS